ncbi:FHA domain-containing protein [Rhodobacterales bacterium HKCCE2091]|nr:FHA domain-containing protein [Rhodobacterales bacterium HKCCE2091]
MISFPVYFRVRQLGPDGTPTGPARTLKCDDPGTFTVGKSDDADVQLDGAAVSRIHLSLVLAARSVAVRDEESTNGTFVNGNRVAEVALEAGDRITIPGWELEFAPVEAEAQPGTAAPQAPPAIVLSRIVEGAGAPPPGPVSQLAAIFGSAPEIGLETIRASGHPVEEVRFLSVGGGLGSFVWIDHLRCYGIPAGQVATIGTETVPYRTYQRYCKNSQIPDHERLRSNSLSRPDNIWGFPGYAMREVGKRGFFKGIFQVFGEPTLAESYTPRAGDVFESLDVEARRIGWQQMFRQGQARGLRKTTDGRYVVAYQPRGEGAGGDRLRFIVADVVHLSTGYPATRFVDDFQNFVAQHPERRGLVANAYEEHDAMYAAIEQTRDPVYVVVRGRGIVASRVIQRLSEARKKNPNLQILHSIRSRLGPRDGAVYKRAKRLVRNNVEIQPFNWPKSCWGGDLRFEYERASEERRGVILNTLGGTSTAERSDWVEIAERGAEEGWYRVVYGSISELDPIEGQADRVRILIRTPEGHNEELFAHFLIDCTGLIADIRRSPFLADLLDTYNLPRNHAWSKQGEKRGPTGLKVSNDFEIEGLRNNRGRVYAAGTITTGGPYLAVDSFLGLQYSALRSVDHLVTERLHAVPDLTPFRSLGGWLKWMGGSTP